MSGEQKNQANDFAKSSVCAGCGFALQRAAAKFCQVCGHDLRRNYQPLDVLRASYNLRAQTAKQQFTKQPQRELRELFSESKNGAASTAIVFAVYSLVPYLGILFCPGALILGGVGLAISYQKPQFGGRETAIYSLLLGALIFVIQILLWWLLYIVPELG